MKTVIVSASLNSESKGEVLCQKVYKKILKRNKQTTFITLKNYSLVHTMSDQSSDNIELKSILDQADNFIFGLPVYNYNVGDAFATFVDSILPKKEHALYGLIIAAGGDKSYLVSGVAHQMLMTHNRMIPMPRVLYGGADWNGVKLTEELSKRIDVFCDDFYTLAVKLGN